jgi:hypothetical protein
LFLDMTHTFRNRLLFLLLLCAALPMSVRVARADACGFTSQLNTPDAALLPYLPSSGSFGTVCVNLNATKTQATVTFTAVAGFMLEALDADVAPNGNGYSGPALGSNSVIAILLGGFSSIPAGGGYTSTDFGPWDTVLGLSPVQTETFVESGAYTDALGVLGANSLGYDAAAHILVCGPNDSTCSSPTASGWVAEKATASSVPEPTSIALLGGVLLFTGSRLKRRAR